MTTQGSTWIDGRESPALAVPDRGLDFGDGLFETLLCRGAQPVLIDYHLERLQGGLNALRFPPVMDQVRQHLATRLATLNETPDLWFAVRLTVTRGSGPRGYAPPPEPVPRVLITVTPLERDCRQCLPPARLGLADLRWAQQPALAGIKHLNRLEQVLVAMECEQQQQDELLVLDQAGRLLSVGAGNLFLVIDDELVTPALTECGVAGTRRRALLERWAPALGMNARQGPVELADLDRATELFYCNSLLGLRPVRAALGREWQQHPACTALFQRYLEELG